MHGILNEHQTCQSIKTITLVTSINTANSEQVFHREFTEKFAYIPTFEYLTVPKMYFHDRYIITDKATLKAGHEFDIGVAKGARADKLSISLCGKQESDETRTFVEKLKKRQYKCKFACYPSW